jgi:hypothetical protein
MPVYSSGFFTAGSRTKSLPYKICTHCDTAGLSSLAAMSSLFQRTPLTTLLELLTVYLTHIMARQIGELEKGYSHFDLEVIFIRKTVCSSGLMQCGTVLLTVKAG